MATNECGVQDPLRLIGVTHAGTYCKLCKSPFAPHKWRTHFLTKHAGVHFAPRVLRMVDILNARWKGIKDNESPALHAQTSRRYKKVICLGCQYVCRDEGKMSLHHGSKYNTCSPASGWQRGECYLLICGRYYPAQKRSVPGALVAQSLPGTESISSARTASQITATNPALAFMNYFSAMPTSAAVGSSKVEAILTTVIDEGDTTKQWFKIFHKFISISADDFIEGMTHQLQDKYLKSEVAMSYSPPLGRLMKLFESLESNMRGIVDGLPSNWKARLVKFELTRAGEDEMEGATSWTFRYRQESSPQLQEFGFLLAYLWRHKCPILQKYLVQAASSTYDEQTSLRHGLIPRLLYELAVEAAPDGNYLPWVCRFALFRCWTLKDQSLRVKSANLCGKMFGTVLYVLREGVLSCASMMLHGGHWQHALDMIDAVQQGFVINTISPWISYCRAMQNQTCPRDASMLAANGDIICRNATFKKSVYRQLIPLVRSSIVRLFDGLFVNDEWKPFVEEIHRIAVRTVLWVSSFVYSPNCDWDEPVAFHDSQNALPTSNTDRGPVVLRKSLCSL